MSRMCARILFIFIGVVSVVLPSFAQSSLYSPFSLDFHAGYEMPVGETAEVFTYGGTSKLSGFYAVQDIPWLSVGGSADYTMTQMQNSKFLSRVGLSGIARAGSSAERPLRFFGFGQGGYSLSFIDVDGEYAMGGNPFFSMGAGAGLRISDTFSLSIRGVYQNYPGFYDSVSLELGSEFRFRTRQQYSGAGGLQISEMESRGKEVLSIESITFERVFPVFYKYYDEHPVGTVTMRNTSDRELSGIELTTNIKVYMDTPKVNDESVGLAPGETKKIGIYALFNNSVLEITEATKVAAEIVADFSVDGEDARVSKVKTLDIYDRNAITWDDDRKAAAFVSAKDPSVLAIAKNIAGIVSRRGTKAINGNLLMGIGIHAALPELGLNYVIDPQTPYVEFSKKTDTIDFLQFPRQTLQYQAGDCDDLSILYCSLLEAVGIETAFITIPGHIYIAFSTGLDRQEASRSFSNIDELIVHDDTAWVPVEVTMIHDGFLAAWAEGAKQWRENEPKGQAVLYPIHEAWKVYTPTGIAAGVEGKQLENIPEVTEKFYAEMIKFIDREIYPKIARLEKRMEAEGETAKLLNHMGVVYARYGRAELSKEYFARALSGEPYVPALINSGNLYFLEKDYYSSLEYYEQALEEEPQSTTAMLGIARANHELENYGTVRRHYRKLQEIEPKLAEAYRYLDLRGDAAGRAASAEGVGGSVIWAE